MKKVFTTGGLKKSLLYAVDDVSFSIAQGETLGLVGESGCGKSTLARVLLMLIPPSAGRVFYKNEEITAATGKRLKQIRAQMQIIFQHPESALNPRLKIYESLTEPMRVQGIVKNRKDEKEKALELINIVGIHEEHLNRYPHELSGGQIQRVVLARILSLQPEFIIADEPTSMLDVSVQAQVLNLLKKIQEQFNMTYLFISHDLDVVRWVSDRIAVMYCGSIVEIGPEDNVYKNPYHPYSSLLLNRTIKTPQFNAELTASLNEFKGCRFYPYCPKATDKCNIKPELEEVGEGHFVACWQL